MNDAKISIQVHSVKQHKLHICVKETPNVVCVFTQSHVQMQLWFPLRGNRLCERSSLKQSLCSPQNQFNFTFQEWSSVPAAELGQGGPRGIKKLGHRNFVCSESVFGRAPRKFFCCQTEGTAKSSRSRSPGPCHYDNRR